MTSTLIHIIDDKTTLDRVTKKSITRPTFIYILNSSLPGSEPFTEAFGDCASDPENVGIRFCMMDYATTTTRNLMKFAPDQMPVVVAMYGENWTRSILGASPTEMEGLVEELREVAAEWLEQKRENALA